MATKAWLQEQGCSFGGVGYVDGCFSNPFLKPWPGDALAEIVSKFVREEGWRTHKECPPETPEVGYRTGSPVNAKAVSEKVRMHVQIEGPNSATQLELPSSEVSSS